MRTKTINKLLKLLKREMPKYITIHWFKNRETASGLCGTITIMYRKGIITLSEYEKLSLYLLQNAPHYVGLLWYPAGELIRRMQWVDKHIKLTSDSLTTRLINWFTYLELRLTYYKK